MKRNSEFSTLRPLLLIALTASFLGLAACGGGGGGGSGTNNPGTTDPGTTDPGTTDPGTDPGTDPDPVVENRAPVAKAGEDQYVNERTEIQLDGSASSDPDGDALSYRWEQTGGPSKVTFDDDRKAKPTITFPMLAPNQVNVSGTSPVELTLTVSDGEKTATDIVEFAVSPVGMVVYASDREIPGRFELYVSDEFGNETKLSDSQHDAVDIEKISVSPDRRWVAWTGDHLVNDKQEIWIAPTDGSLEGWRVTHDLPPRWPLGPDIKQLDWSSQNVLAFIANIDTESDEDDERVNQLYAYDPESGVLEQSASLFVDELRNTNNWVPGSDGCWDSDRDCANDDDVPSGDVEAFAWSPDGECIAYIADKAMDVNAAYLTCDGGESSIEISRLFVDENGNDEWDMAPVAGALPDGYARDLKWSPDGRSVAMVARHNPDHFNDEEVHVHAVETASTYRVAGRSETSTTTSHVIARYEWSPSSEYLAIISNPADQDRDYLRTVRLGETLAESNLSKSGNWPNPTVASRTVSTEILEWSPDSAHVLFLAENYKHDGVHQYLVNTAETTTFDFPWKVLDRYRDVYVNGEWDGALYAYDEMGDGWPDADGSYNNNGDPWPGGEANNIPDDAYPYNSTLAHESLKSGFWSPADPNVLAAVSPLRISSVMELFGVNVLDNQHVELSDVFRDEYDNLTGDAGADGFADHAFGSTNRPSPIRVVKHREWSPNGQWIAHEAAHTDTSRSEIVVTSSDGSIRHTISNTDSLHPGFPRGMVRGGHWLSNSRLVYATRETNREGTEFYSCAVVDLDGSNRIYLGATEYATGATGSDQCIPVPVPINELK